MSLLFVEDRCLSRENESICGTFGGWGSEVMNGLSAMMIAATGMEQSEM